MSNLPEPTNFNDARRQATRFASAKKCLTDGYRFIKAEWTDATLVYKPGSETFTYMIFENGTINGLTMQTGCDCPDYLRHGGYCKHTMALDILKLEDEEAQFRALCEANGVEW